MIGGFGRKEETLSGLWIRWTGIRELLGRGVEGSLAGALDPF